MRKLFHLSLLLFAFISAISMQAQTVTTKHYLVVNGENKELAASETLTVTAGDKVRPYAHAYIVATAYEINGSRTENTETENANNVKDGNFNNTFYYTATDEAEQEVTFYYRESLPFITSTDLTTDVYWYNLGLYSTNGLNEYWLGAEEDGRACVHYSRQPLLNILWCFVGNLVDGFYIYNYDGRKLSYNSEKPVISSEYHDRWKLQLPTTGDPYKTIRICKMDGTGYFANEGHNYVEYTTDSDVRANINLFWTGEFLFEFLRRARESQKDSYIGALGSFSEPSGDKQNQLDGLLDAINLRLESKPAISSTDYKSFIDRIKRTYYQDLRDFSYLMTNSFIPLDITPNGYYLLYNRVNIGCLNAGLRVGDKMDAIEHPTDAQKNMAAIVRLIPTGSGTYNLKIQGAKLRQDGIAMVENDENLYNAEFLYQENSKFYIKNSTGYLTNDWGEEIINTPTAYGEDSKWALISVTEYELELGGPYSDADKNSTYATRCLPFTVQIPADIRLEAYIAKDDTEGYVLLSTIEKEADGSTIIPAETPVMFIGHGINTATLNILVDDYTDKKPIDNDFHGTLFMTSALAPAITAYGLGHKTGEDFPKFYKLSSDPAKRSIAANRAYLVAPSGGSVKAMRFKNDATDITSATVQKKEETTFYDLNGRRVLYPTRGIYVTGDGQKVFIK